MRPTVKVVSASFSSMRVFQNRMLSGSPSRSRGPGNNSRKKSASWASKDRKPFGTILRGWVCEVGVVAVTEEVPDRLDAIAVDGGWTTGVIEGELMTFALEDCWLTVCSARKCRRSSAMSFAVEYRSEAR